MARVDVVMPKMGESVMEGTVLAWKKQVGDAVELDETLLEISTDKVDSEVPAPAAGRLAAILVAENDTVDVGVPIAVIETDVNAALDAAPSAPAPADASVEAPAAPVAEAEPAAEAHTESVGDGSGAEGAIYEAEPEAPAQTHAIEQPASASSPAPSAAPTAGAGGERIQVVMPKMGESVMEGTVLAWKKQVGDAVELDETLLEISTDKVDSEVPAPAAGTLVEILVQENETVDVGAPIAVIATGAMVSTSAPASAAPAPAAAPAPPTEPAPSQKGYGVTPGGDGAPTAAPAQAQDAEHVPVGHDAPGEMPRRTGDGRFVSPLVRSIAKAEGLSAREIEALAGSGAEGRVTKKDVLAYLDTRPAAPAAAPPTPVAQPATAPAAPSAPPVPAAAPARPAAPAVVPADYGDRVEVVEMDRMRQLIAEHMVRSTQTSAHVTSFAEVDVTGLVQHREKHKKAFEAREGVKLTYTPYFLRAAIEPLRAHPYVNASVEGKRVLLRKDFHIGIAVALGTRGLLVPIVRDAGQKNLTGLARTVADLAERARSKQLGPDELQGGTFTLTNVGSLGSLMGTPIINQPQVAILSPGAIVKRPVVVEHPELGDLIAVRHMVYVSLSYDHRIIDGAMAASFLKAYREALEAITPASELFLTAVAVEGERGAAQRSTE